MDTDLRARFLEGMSRVAAAVTVVTTDGEAGRFGVTVSSMTSVSADTTRPSLLISIHHMSPACEAIRRNRRFCANVLSGNQSHVSDLFSGRLKHLNEDRFGSTSWRTGATGAPIVDGAVVSFDCELQTALLWGTHFIFVGEVAQIELSGQKSPLVYANRGYRRAIPISPYEHQPQRPENQLRVGFFITLGPQFVPALVAGFAKEYPEVDLRLLEADHDDLVEQLSAGGIEAAITFGSAGAPGLNAELLCPPAPHILVASEHPLAGKDRLSLEDVAELPMILFDHPSVRTATTELYRRNGHEPVVRFQSPSFAMVRGLVAQGLGYSLVPQPPQAMAAPGGKDIRAIPLDAEFPEAAIIAISREAALQSPVARDFLARCRASFRPLAQATDENATSRR